MPSDLLAAQVSEALRAFVSALIEENVSPVTNGVPQGAASITKVAKFFSIGPKRIRSAVENGELDTFCDGKVFYADVEAWMRTQRDRKERQRIRLVG